MQWAGCRTCVPSPGPPLDRARPPPTAATVQAHAALDAVQAARDAVRGNEGALRGAIDIGAMTAVAVIDLPALLRPLHTNHPGVAIRLRVSPTGFAGLSQALVAGELDAAFLSLAGRTPGGLTTGFVPHGSPGAGRPSAGLPAAGGPA
ncbi:LysR substrate-binding domain-containing protein [Streptomyces sp. NBC_01589]|uniref:LysR substrate-binding domain-containing protein n=1 Tax=unclassified Streptomyces TaxID=2593676 RepID=UPI00386718A3